MKFIIIRVAAGLLLVTMLGATAMAKGKQKHLTFSDDLNVNGTVVKKGDYKVVFNEETGELSILKGRKVVAKSSVRLEMRVQKAKHTEVLTRQSDMGTALISITFGGSDQSVVLSQTAMQAGVN